MITLINNDWKAKIDSWRDWCKDEKGLIDEKSYSTKCFFDQSSVALFLDRNNLFSGWKKINKPDVFFSDIFFISCRSSKTSNENEKIASEILFRNISCKRPGYRNMLPEVKKYSGTKIYLVVLKTSPPKDGLIDDKITDRLKLSWTVAFVCTQQQLWF